MWQQVFPTKIELTRYKKYYNSRIFPNALTNRFSNLQFTTFQSPIGTVSQVFPHRNYLAQNNKPNFGQKIKVITLDASIKIALASSSFHHWISMRFGNCRLKFVQIFSARKKKHVQIFMLQILVVLWEKIFVCPSYDK